MVAGVLAGHLLLLHSMGSGTSAAVPGTAVDGDPFLLYYYKDLLCTVHSMVGGLSPPVHSAMHCVHDIIVPTKMLSYLVLGQR